jgi:hypothetical protein
MRSLSGAACGTTRRCRRPGVRRRVPPSTRPCPCTGTSTLWSSARAGRGGRRPWGCTTAAATRSRATRGCGSTRPAPLRRARPGWRVTTEGCPPGCAGHAGARRPPRPPRTRHPSPASPSGSRRAVPRSVSSDSGSPRWAPRQGPTSPCTARRRLGSASAASPRWGRARRAPGRPSTGSRWGSTGSPRRATAGWCRPRRDHRGRSAPA